MGWTNRESHFLRCRRRGHQLCWQAYSSPEINAGFGGNQICPDAWLSAIAN